MLRWMFLAITAYLGLLASAPAVHAADRLTVVELFTSQNCPKCPPANRLLAELAERDDILALSWSVDYWDSPKWQDTFGSRQHSERQADYNRNLGRKGVYTPQLIINGRAQTVGSDRDRVLAAIKTVRRNIAATVDITLTGNEEAYTLTFGPVNTDARLITRAIWFRDGETVAIARGANRGKSILYRNVVITSRELEHWGGQAHKLTLALDEAPKAADRLAIIVQEGEAGPILGAAWRAIPGRKGNMVAHHKDS